MQVIKALSRPHAALAIVGALVFAHVVLRWTIGRNISAGVYETEGNLLVFAFIHSLPIALLGITGALMPRHRMGWRIVSRTLLVLAGLYAFVLAGSWCYPDHYFVAAAFFLVPLACVWALWQPHKARGQSADRN